MPRPGRNQYPIFHHWAKTLDWIMDKGENMPKHARYTLTNRIIGLSIDILEDIVTAIYSKRKLLILRKINLNLEKLRVFFRICFQRTYLSEKQYAYVSEQLETTGKMCGGWIKSCKE